MSDTHGENVRPTALTTSECTSLNVVSVSKGIQPLIWRVRGLVRLVVMNVHIPLQAVRFFELGTGLEEAPKSI